MRQIALRCRTNLSWAPFSIIVCCQLIVSGQAIGQERARPRLASLTDTVVYRSTVQILVPTHYDDSDSSVAILTLLMRALPPTRETIESGETISQLILRRYGFGPTNLPITYDSLVSRILSLNSLTRPEAVKPGDILVPSIPRRSLVFPNRAKASNYVPVWTTTQVHAADSLEQPANADLTQLEFDKEWSSDAPDRSAKQSALLTFQLTTAQARQLWTASPELETQGRLYILSSVIDIDLGEPLAADSAHHTVLAPEERRILTDVLNRAQRRVPVFIVDAGWPSNAAFRESVSYLTQAIAEVWKRYGFGNYSPPSLTFVPPKLDHLGNNHAIQIDSALSEFRDLDPRGEIQLVYLPMTRDQGSLPLLQDLVTTSYMLLWQRQAGLQAPLESSDKRKATKAAAADLKAIAPDATQGRAVRSASAVLTGLWSIVDDIGQNRKAFYFVSTSWTVADRVLGTVLAGVPWGLGVAAAGNFDNTNIDLQGYDFAQRSSQSRTFMAVLNLAKDGTKLCHTSVLSDDEQLLSHRLVVGFDGAIPAGSCGTSYSAPRVAWILAADEAARTTPIDNTLWSVRLLERLKQLRDPQRKLEGLALDILRFLHPPT